MDPALISVALRAQQVRKVPKVWPGLQALWVLVAQQVFKVRRALRGSPDPAVANGSSVTARRALSRAHCRGTCTWTA